MNNEIRNIKRHSDSQINYGFTLIEILVSSAILVILAAGYLGLQFILSQNQTAAWKSYQSIEDANLAISTLEKELRNARQSETGGYPLEKADDQEIIFYSFVLIVLIFHQTICIQ